MEIERKFVLNNNPKIMNENLNCVAVSLSLSRSLSLWMDYAVIRFIIAQPALYECADDANEIAGDSLLT